MHIMKNDLLSAVAIQSCAADHRRVNSEHHQTPYSADMFPPHPRVSVARQTPIKHGLRLIWALTQVVAIDVYRAPNPTHPKCHSSTPRLTSHSIRVPDNAFQSLSSPSAASAGWIPGNVFFSNNSGDTPR